MTLSGTEVRVGMKIEIDDVPYEILKAQHQKTANRRAVMQVMVRNLMTGQVLDKTFHEREKFEQPDLNATKMQFLYKQGDDFVFMDNKTYEQINFSTELIGDPARFLKEGLDVDVLMFRGRPINVQLPAAVKLQISRTEPGIRGDTATNVTKPATLETGAVVKVPIFINEGDVIKVDTRSGDYLERTTTD